jgi:two-component system CheB/CheR fusion protein
MPSDRGHRPDTAALRESGAGETVSTRSLLVVAIGASAGGLEACQRLADGLSPDADMAFILVQHLDPGHKSLMVELLAHHTQLTVVEATEGAPLQRAHLYVIPPGTYLAVETGVIRLSKPLAPHGARLPFDFLLQSLSLTPELAVACIVLSGAGADGSLGLMAVKAQGGLVIAQTPQDAAYDSMPRSAIATGDVDLILSVDDMPAALAEYQRQRPPQAGPTAPHGVQSAPAGFADIIALLRERLGHDFSLYKPGTLLRRIERRIGLAGPSTSGSGSGPAGMADYLKRLQDDAQELDLLAKDLLINVTSFFRDPQVFDYLAESVIPALVRDCKPGQPLRIWTAGCSTGEETYSLAMLLREEIDAQKVNIKLQIFASDLDSEAVATAREGLYPPSIAADVSAARLARFFQKEPGGYRVLADLRSAVVFTIQDVLTDPPFSRLDLISCRNLLIYLQPEAQAKIISIFHFALQEGGLLLLGASEAVTEVDGRFKMVSKTARLYRHVGRSRPGEFALLMGAPAPVRPGLAQALSTPNALAELCRRLVLERHAPAAVLINARGDCLYSLGPTDRYLRVAPGSPSHDLMSMVRHGMRTRLSAALQEVIATGQRVVVRGGRAAPEAGAPPLVFDIEVQPVARSRDAMILICFLDQPKAQIAQNPDVQSDDVERDDAPLSSPRTEDRARIAELEQELELARADLNTALRNLELSSDEQTAINEEALSVNEEYQSANEELLTSKEELQSLNEELTALNSQLQESLERQRTSANDLQNILYSTDVATLFLDGELKIRFFTPATRALFNILPGDIGRPLADLSVLAADDALLDDARTTLALKAPKDREVEAKPGVWFSRRILPYRAHDQTVEGVVITFTDVTERRRIDFALNVARQQAEAANLAKSRFLAAASHDLRQPLQTLTLLQGLLSNKVEGDAARKLIALLEQTVGAMSAMLNTLLDIDQIDAGVVEVEATRFALNLLLDRMRDEFTYHARAKNLSFRVIPCSLMVETDARLLEQMLRNLITNALKYTKTGKVLLGCRRHGGLVSVWVLDTGVGIPAEELAAIFEEYHQVDNAARERARGLGLGLSIVQRLGALLKVKVRVAYNLGRGSTFAIDLPRAEPVLAASSTDSTAAAAGESVPRQRGSILIVEDDPEVRDLLALALREAGHRVFAFADGLAALDAVHDQRLGPDVIVADYNLPGGMHGVRLAAKLRLARATKTPTIILTGDISKETLRTIDAADCVSLHKPVKLATLVSMVDTALATAPLPNASARPSPPTTADQWPDSGSAEAHDRSAAVIYLVDDDELVLDLTSALLRQDGFEVETYSDCESFLRTYSPGRHGCLILDARLPGINGLELLIRLRETGDPPPVIIITGGGDLAMAVQAMKVGASDFIEKPIGRDELLASVERALVQSRDSGAADAWREAAKGHMMALTARQREIMDLVLAGHPSKNIAADLGISQRTVENHRAAIMHKTGAKSLPALARLALAAGPIGA